MTRKPCGPAARGSQRWLQLVANRERALFDLQLAQAGLGPALWLSPLEPDEYAEYRDHAFLRRLDLQLPHRSLETFWPEGGPVWDGLARTEAGSILLIEAKANLPELASSASRAGPASAALIARSLDEAKPSFGAPASANWAGTYYQYANRLAHLHLLRACNRVDAYLVFLYFTGAADVHGPQSIDEWRPAIEALHRALELGVGPLTPFVVDLFVDVAHLPNPAK